MVLGCERQAVLPPAALRAGAKCGDCVRPKSPYEIIRLVGTPTGRHCSGVPRAPGRRAGPAVCGRSQHDSARLHCRGLPARPRLAGRGRARRGWRCPQRSRLRGRNGRHGLSSEQAERGAAGFGPYRGPDRLHRRHTVLRRGVLCPGSADSHRGGQPPRLVLEGHRQLPDHPGHLSGSTERV